MTGKTGTRIAGWTAILALPVFLVGSALFATPLFPSWFGAFPEGSAAARIALVLGGGGLAIAGMLMGVVGLALYVLIPSFSGRGLALQGYGSHRVVLACTILAILIGNLLAALYLIPASNFISEFGHRGLGADLLSPRGIAVAALALDVALMAVVYVRVVRPGAISWHRMGLERAGLRRRVLLGLAFGFLLLVASAVLESMMERLGIRQTQTQLFGSVRGASPAEFLLVLIAGAIVAPVVEEIYFRGFVFRAYLDQKGLRRAFVYSAGLFAIVHLNLAAFVPIFTMGLLLSLFYRRTESLIPGIVAHAVNNAAAFLLLYMGAQ